MESTGMIFVVSTRIRAHPLSLSIGGGDFTNRAHSTGIWVRKRLLTDYHPVVKTSEGTCGHEGGAPAGNPESNQGNAASAARRGI